MGAMMVVDLTKNKKKRAPICPITRAMAEAGKASMTTLMQVDDGAGVTDDQLVAEIFAAMWKVYWEQVFELQGKNLKAPASTLLLPKGGIVRN